LFSTANWSTSLKTKTKNQGGSFGTYLLVVEEIMSWKEGLFFSNIIVAEKQYRWCLITIGAAAIII
jgi:hypothetical protein